MDILVSKINFLGDAVAFLPALKGLVDYAPQAKITIICTAVGRQVFEGSAPQLEFFTVDKPQVLGRAAIPTLIKTLRGLRSSHFSVALHSHDEPSFSYLLSRALKVPRRIGYRSGIARFEFLLTEAIDLDASRNVVDINYDLVRHLSRDRGLVPTRVPISYSPEDKHVVAARLSGIGVDVRDRFIVIHTGAKLAYREWSADRYASLARRIESHIHLPVLFVRESLNAAASPAQTLAGFSVKQLACLLDIATGFIGNNSGPMHIAAAMGTPCVVIQGPTAPNWEIFWQDAPHRTLTVSHLPCVPCERLCSIPGRCLNEDYPHGCMKEISVEMVERAVAETVKTARAGTGCDA